MTTMKAIIGHGKIIPILVVEELDTAIPACQSVAEAGINYVEVVLRGPLGLKAIRKIAAAIPEMTVGGGTVLSVDQAEMVFDAGGKFIVSPGFDEKTAEFCREHELPYLPGCVTAGEIQKACLYNLDVLKFFPAFETGGLKAMKMFNGPFPDVYFIPTGGINSDNMCGLLAYDHVLAVGGAWMFLKNNALKRKDYAAVTANLKTDLSRIEKRTMPSL
ncbi:MAG: bifunctional 4-hydroxy-2-oxoglutarate aldolase/2-dehydro-3-deoxy-phosphogluconate aldolase [Victivallales bacterium]|nr:bifunctional 4-hydroxy-2-oxoglutarate aldolase/2-dehydro-3-deoxy-phosphogluconate aldolase [Victivallales bacterium]